MKCAEPGCRTQTKGAYCYTHARAHGFETAQHSTLEATMPLTVEVLHSYHGDKSQHINTDTEEGRQEAAILLNRLMRQGATVILQRGTKAYTVEGYDPTNDTLKVRVETRRGRPAKTVEARADKSTTTAVAPSAGG